MVYTSIESPGNKYSTNQEIYRVLMESTHGVMVKVLDYILKVSLKSSPTITFTFKITLRKV